MAINSNSTLVNQFIPDFRLTNLLDGEILAYDIIRQAFVNTNDLSNTTIVVGPDNIADYAVHKVHLFASDGGAGSEGNVLVVDSSNEIAWKAIIDTGVIDISTVKIGELLNVANSADLVLPSATPTDDEYILKWIPANPAAPIAGEGLWTPSLNAVSMDDLTDVDTSSIVPTPNQILEWNGSTWIPGDQTGSAPVDSVFSRTGIVIAEASDYDASQVDNDSTVVGAFVSDALNTLDTAITGIDITVKADKVLLATAGNFAGLDATGNLTDSGFIDTDFALVVHTHTSSDITDFNAAVNAIVSTVKLVDLADTDAPALADGFLRWDPSGTSVVYQTTISVADISGLATVATTGDYVDLLNLPVAGIDFAAVIHPHVKADITDFSDGDYATAAQGLLAGSAAQATDVISFFADVNPGTALVGQALVWGGFEWIPTTLNSSSVSLDLDNLGDVNTPAPSANEVLTWNSIAGEWQALPVTSSTVLMTLGDLTDVDDDSSLPGDIGQFLRFGSAGRWENVDYGWADISGKPATFPPSVHTHVAADITDFDAAVELRNPFFTFTALADTTALPVANNFLRWDAGGTAVEYVAITAADVSGLATVATTGDYVDLLNLPVAGIDFAAVIHNHTTADVTGLDTALLGKADKIVPATTGDLAALDASGNLADSGFSSADFALVVHTHVEADITDLDKYTQVEVNSAISAAVNVKIDKVSGAVAGNIPEFVLGGTLVDSGNTFADYALVVHTHVEADITDLDKYTVAAVDALLLGKAPTVHTHVKANITDFSDSDYATFAQGVTADTAVQPADNISVLTNDAGYITVIGIDALTDVDTSTTAPTAGQVLIWDGIGEWIPGSQTTAAPVDSVFGNTGVIVAAASDYDASQVDNDSGVTGAFVSDALNTLNTDKADKIIPVTAGDFAALDASGNLADSGLSSSSFATAAQGTTADSAVQPLDNVSVLTNDAGYITALLAPVTSIFTRTGDVTAAASDYDASQVDNDSTVVGAFVSDALDTLDTDKADKIVPAVVGNFAGLDASGNLTDSGFIDTDFATAAQGVTADTALQPGNNVSELVNDVGYLTAVTTPVDSVHGRTGTVVSAASDYDASQVDNDSTVVGVFVSDALDTLETTKIVDSPVDGTQYTRKDAAWSGLGTEMIPLSTGVSIQNDLGNNLVSWDITSGGDPLFPSVPFVHIGETGMAIDINAVLFQPLKIKNDTAIQGYDSTYATLFNLVSVSADDFVTVGDGGTAQVAVRSETALLDPVVRQGTFGLTTDYIIMHEGNLDIISILDLGDVNDTPIANAYLRWNSAADEVIYEENIDAGNISGLASVATTGNIFDLVNVDATTGTILSGQVLAWNGTDFIASTPSTGGSGASTLLGLDDTTVATWPTAEVGEVLRISGESGVVPGTPNWANARLLYSDLDPSSLPTSAAYNLLGLSDTEAVAIANTYLRWNALGTEVVYVTIDANDISNLAVVAITGDYSDLINQPTIPSVLSDMTDVSSSIPVNGQALTWNNSSSMWEPGLGGGGAAGDLGDLDDVVLAGETNYDFLMFTTGGDWINAAIDYDVNVLNAKPNVIDLDDTTAIAVGDGYLRWNAAGTTVLYETTIPAASVSGLATVATTGDYNDLLNQPGTGTLLGLTDTAGATVPNGFLIWDGAGTTVIYDPFPIFPIQWSIISTSQAANANSSNYVDTTSGIVTVTLPPTPSEGEFVRLVDYAQQFATNNMIVDPGVDTINGAAGLFPVTADGQAFKFTYTVGGAVTGWLITSDAGTGSAGGGNYPPDWSIISVNTTAVDEDAFMVDTSGGVVTVTLPLAPVADDQIKISDYSGTFRNFPLTVARNGQPINGVAQDAVITRDWTTATFTYVDATVGWRPTQISASSLSDGAQWIVINTNTTALSGDELFVDTTGGGLTVTLPLNPSANDTVRVADLYGTTNVNPILIDRNGHNIMNGADNVLISNPNASIELTYVNVGVGWKITDGLGELLSFIDVPFAVYVATTGNDTTGTGSSTAPFATIQRAVDWAEQITIGVNGSITIRVEPGVYNEPARVEINHQDGDRLFIEGVQTTASTTISSVVSASASAITITPVSMAGITLGKYVRITGATGTGNPELANGIFVVAAVGGADFTVNPAYGATLPAISTLTGGTVEIHDVEIHFAGFNGFEINTALGHITNAIVAGNGTAHNGIVIAPTAKFLAQSFLSVYNFGTAGITVDNGTFIAPGVVVSQNGTGVSASNNSNVDINSSVVTYNTVNGVTNTSNSVVDVVSSVVSGNDIGVLSTTGGFVDGTSATITASISEAAKVTYGMNITLDSATLDSTNNAGAGATAMIVALGSGSIKVIDLSGSGVTYSPAFGTQNVVTNGAAYIGNV